MSCKYHPSAQRVRNCSRCKSTFCDDCAIEFTGKEEQLVCLDCGVAFAKRKLRNSIIAATLGVAGAAWMVSSGAQPPGMSRALAIVFYGYAFWAVYWGWHFGGKFWGWLYNGLDRLSDGHWIGSLIAFFVRFIAAAAIGMYGGAIYRTVQAVKLIRLHKSHAAAVQAAY